MAQLASWGALTYGMFAVGAEGIVQMFYAISRRRRDLNAAEDKGRVEGRVEGSVATPDEMAARLSEPGADPMAVIARLRAELRHNAPSPHC